MEERYSHKIALPVLWEQIVTFEQTKNSLHYPKLSIIIPTNNSSHSIGLTLENLLAQDYPDFEIIIVDYSTDRTLEIIKGFGSEKIHVFQVSDRQRYEMLNKGLSQASGQYVNFLFPGDFYIYHQALKYLMMLALQHHFPDLLYCGTLLRDAKEEVKILFRNLSLDLLKKGQQPTSLQSCWYRTEALRKIGKFDPHYHVRGGFELFCRFYLNNQLSFMPVNRVLTDYDLRSVSRRMILVHFWETLITIHYYFGFFAALRWLFFYQKDWKRFLKLWKRSFASAFSGK